MFLIILLLAWNNFSFQLTRNSNKILMPGSNYSLLKEPSAKAYEESKVKLPGGKSVSIIKTEDDWALIEANGQSGWILKWFIINENSDAKLLKLNTDYMILKEKTQGQLYPDGPTIVELEKGNLIKPLFRWDDWIQVSIIQFDIPSISVTWIKENLLALSSEVEPNEGFLRVGCPAYEILDFNKISSVNPTTVKYSMQVRLKKRQGEFIWVSGPSEWDAWVKSSDILYTKID